MWSWLLYLVLWSPYLFPCSILRNHVLNSSFIYWLWRWTYRYHFRSKKISLPLLVIHNHLRIQSANPCFLGYHLVTVLLQELVLISQRHSHFEISPFEELAGQRCHHHFKIEYLDFLGSFYGCFSWKLALLFPYHLYRLFGHQHCSWQPHLSLATHYSWTHLCSFRIL